MEAELTKNRGNSRGAWSVVVATLVLPLLAAGCTDQAEAPFQECARLKGEAKLDEAIKACERAVGADAKSKAGVAAASMLSDLRSALADRERQASETRKALLASGKADDLRKLLKDYPGSTEAKEADDGLRKLTSVCANRSSWQLTYPIRRLGERPGQVALMSGMSAAFGKASAEGTAEKCEKEAKQLDDTAAEIAAHGAMPGEEAVRDTMVANHKQLADQNRKWARAFKAYDGDLAPFTALQTATERLTEQALEKDTDTFNACLKLPAGVKP
jgi:hypothetical protein